MPKRRIVMLVLAALFLVPGLFLATKDVFAEGQNCGSAVLRKNTTQLTEDTGDIIDNDFNAEKLSKECDQNIVRQRFLTAIFLLIAVVPVVIAYRSKPAEPRFPGDSVI
jgi:hypothetical protein